MTAPKRKNRQQWKTNYIPKKKKYYKLPIKLLKQFGGKHKMRKSYVKLRKRYVKYM